MAPDPTTEMRQLQHFLDLTNGYVAKLRKLAGDEPGGADKIGLTVTQYAETVAGQAIAAVRRWPA